MIRLNLQMFGGGGGDSGLAADHGSSGGSGIGNGGGGKTSSKTTKQEATENGVTGKVAEKVFAATSKSSNSQANKIDHKASYNVEKVKDGRIKPYDDDMNGKDVDEFLKGFHYDSKTGLWKDRSGKVYRVTKRK